ncbi:MAG: hypothetical protein GY699_15435 [Desulfobacteraceae bacterium]|nr:hypothetical protein [Desulfobacteraceae bacterium]
MLRLSTPILKILLLPIIPFLLVCSCSNGIDNNENILTINNFTMTKNEFEKLCTQEMEYNNAYKTSIKAKQDLLDKIIKKELLIQEAQSQGIDKDDKFMATIEKYWEATLIKHLMERKNKEIQDTTTISDKEIKKKYNDYKLKNNTLPALDEIEKEIALEIMESKKTQRVKNWMDSLHKTADIKFEKDYFNE